ncbi:hypothetical protein NONI108955_33145 [Nocardia ninae]|uniref:Uncharacterized protein n=1 Tax=Nocardia ninae NBRC 108245 TaxID=1210091 RepID=A0A511MEN3_9NOCA|nr:hypothetical protein NN4_36390 [Nocardia ninae NBRC 108245]
MTINLRAWTGEFHDVSWTEVARFFRAISDSYPDFQHLTDIVDSIRGSGCDHQLAGQMSMHDLIVTTRPIPEPPIEEVVVRAPGSLVPVPEGAVVIDCLSDASRANRIVAPVSEAVPLFWRFATASFGVTPIGPPE